MRKFLSDNGIILVMSLAFITSTVMAVRNTYIIKINRQIIGQTDEVKTRTGDILTTTMHGIDLGVRGYALTLDEKLLNPFNEAVASTPDIFRTLDEMLVAQNYPRRSDLQAVQDQVNEYIRINRQMIEAAKNGQMDTFVATLKEDKGYDVWKKYSDFSTPLFQYEDELNQKSLAEYQAAIRNNLILQLAILALVMPTLWVFVSKVKKERTARKVLLSEVEFTDKTFVFNDGLKHNEESEDINKVSIAHVKQASEFIAAITKGNYEVNWDGLTNANTDLNTQTLAGNLVRLRDHLKAVKEEDERRNWANEGVAQFMEIIRNYQNQGEQFYVKCISFLTNYISAQHGSLFLADDSEGETVLKLAACFAFDKRKWVEKKISIGDGLVGQAYLEGSAVKIKQVPPNYIHITSGLGHATPRCIVIIPLKNDNETPAIAEFATFNELADYQVTFLQKAGEYLASAISSASTTEKMKSLLQEASVREESMRQREEELRQNMEELQAIQEEMARKQSETEKALLR